MSALTIDQYKQLVQDGADDLETLKQFMNDVPADVVSRLGATYPNIRKLVDGFNADRTSLQTLLNATTDASLIGQLIDADYKKNKREIRFHVDPNYAGVFGMTSTYFATVSDALQNCVDGALNLILLRNSNDFYAGGENPQNGGADLVSRSFYLDTTIAFMAWGGTPRLHFPYYRNAAGTSLCACRFGNPSGYGVKTTVGFYGITVDTIAATDDNGDIVPALPYYGLLYPGYTSQVRVFMRGGSLTISEGTNLIGTYVTGTRLEIGLQYCSFNGHGDMVHIHGHGTITFFHHNSLSRPAGSTNFIFSHAKTDRSNHVLAVEPSFYARNNN